MIYAVGSYAGRQCDDEWHWKVANPDVLALTPYDYQFLKSLKIRVY
jgi:hypothetical protein